MTPRRLRRVAVQARNHFRDHWGLQQAAVAVRLRCQPFAWMVLGDLGREVLEDWFMEALTDALTEEICDEMHRRSEEEDEDDP